MKKLLAITVAALMGLTLFSTAQADDKTPWQVNRRQNKQAQRIKTGVRSGELTKRETKNLVNGQRRINHKEAELRADGRLSKKDHVKLKAMQEKQNANIDRKKNNDRDRD